MTERVAITVSADEGMASPLDPRFGRSSYFLVAEKSDGGWSAVAVEKNEAKDAPNGAGGKAAAQISRLGATAVISGRFGPKAYQALLALGVRMWQAGDDNTGASALQALDAGALEEMKVAVY